MKSIWILHEGNAKKTHDNALICLLIEHLSQTNPAISLDKVEFHGMGAKSNFFDTASYPKLLKDGVTTDKISNVLLVVDADYVADNATYGGFENTQNELGKTIAALGFKSVCDIYVMCDPTTKTGYLESFLLSTIPVDRKVCIQSFLDCSEFKSKENHKAIWNAIYTTAYPITPYDFSHPHFDELKTKLISLFGIN
jgi:hypothetical protein